MPPYNPPLTPQTPERLRANFRTLLRNDCGSRLVYVSPVGDIWGVRFCKFTKTIRHTNANNIPAGILYKIINKLIRRIYNGK